MSLLFLRLLLRDGQVLFWNVAFFPLVLVLFLSVVGGDEPAVRTTLAAAIVTVGVMANALFSVAVGVASARERGVYRLYATAGGASGAPAASMVVARGVVIAAGAALELVIVYVVFGAGWPGGLLAVSVLVAGGTTAFCALALAIAAKAQSSRAANRTANLFLIPLMVLGGTSIPAAMLPDWWNAVRGWLPTAALNDGLVAAMVGDISSATLVHPLLVLAAWTGASLVAAWAAWPAIAPIAVRGLMRRRVADAGFAAPEAAAIVASMAILAATAGPHMQEYIETARMTKARGDVRVIAVSMVRLLADVGSVHGPEPLRTQPALLVTAGTVPAAAASPEYAWTGAIDDRVQRLEWHLVDNGAGYPERGGIGANWRGPYLERLSSDPWGGRYGANVGMLRHARPGLTVVLSAGPNQVVETPFVLERLTAGGDDVLALVWATR